MTIFNFTTSLIFPNQNCIFQRLWGLPPQTVRVRLFLCVPKKPASRTFYQKAGLREKWAKSSWVILISHEWLLLKCSSISTNIACLTLWYTTMTSCLPLWVLFLALLSFLNFCKALEAPTHFSLCSCIFLLVDLTDSIKKSDLVNNLSPQTILAICSWSVLKPVT